jgi:subfamily B ATP-binding cassette protein MsbA
LKKFAVVFKYIKHTKKNFILYLLFTVLSIVFSLISLAALAPFMKLLFKKEGFNLTRPVFEFSGKGIYTQISYELSELIAKGGAESALIYICLVVLASIFFKNLFAYMAATVLTPIRNYVMSKLRNDLYDKILRLPVGYFTEQKKGDLMARMSSDIHEVEVSILSTMEGLIKDPLNILILLVVLFFLSYQLTLLMFVLLPLIGFIIGRLSRTLKKDSGKLQHKYGQLLNVLEETLGNIRIVKAFTAEKFMNEKFININKDIDKVKTAINLRREMASPLSEFLGVVALCIVLWFGGRLVLSGDSLMEADQFITYIVMFSQIINPAKSLTNSYYNLRKGGAAIERIEEILGTPDTITEKPNAVNVSSFNSAVEFKNVSFKYGDTTVLNNISFTIPKGKTVALVGSSGAGKSTLADLLPRFHDVSSGEVLIDGVNIKDYTLKSLRGLMGIVTQEPLLFNDTVKANIALGVENITLPEIEQAAKIANALDYIKTKEGQFDSLIGERGTRLSGGERQRLTIARAIYKNPPILILDEATSSLDTESERLVQNAIDRLMQERTSLVIAHRLSTIRNASEIIVLQKGEVVERGTHDELIAVNGFYKKLVDMQEVK